MKWCERALALPVLSAASLPKLPLIDHILLGRFQATCAISNLAQLLFGEATREITYGRRSKNVTSCYPPPNPPTLAT